MFTTERTVRASARRFPSERIARGWYQIGWSDEFAVGEVVPLRYFESDLIAYRGESGILRVLDAFCLHLGAHLGYGGTVEGDSVRCPFHGWLWGQDGANTEIPYGSCRAMENLRLRRWSVVEVDELVLVYFSYDETREPEPPPPSLNRYETPIWDVTAEMRHSWREMPMTPQMLAENSVDAAHFKYVHRSNDVAEVRDFTITPGCFAAEIKIRFGGGHGPTWATPNGPVDGTIGTEQWGVGIGRAQLKGFDDITFVSGVTPITAHLSDIRSTTYVPLRRRDGSPLDATARDRWVREQNAQVDSDLIIWNNQSYMHKPHLDRSEVGPTRAFRQWARELYDDRTPPPVAG